MKKFISKEVLHKVADEAYKANQRYYGHADMKLLSLSEAPQHVQNNVIRDVKAVLLGNRQPKDLHEAWRQRKIVALYGKPDWHKARYNDFIRAECETAWSCWELLSYIDQEGYRVFVNTVKHVYKELTEQPVAIKQEEFVTSGTKALDLVLATSRCTHTSTYRGCGDAVFYVQVGFSSFEAAQAFKKAVLDVKR